MSFGLLPPGQQYGAPKPQMQQPTAQLPASLTSTTRFNSGGSNQPYKPVPVKMPGFMPQAGKSLFDELKSLYGGMQNRFDTDQAANDAQFNSVLAGNAASGQAAAGAAARAAQVRATRNGGAVAASFAQGGLNLNNMRQNNASMLDYMRNKMANQQANTGMQANAANALGQGRLGQANLLSNFYNQQQGFNLQNRGLNMQQDQFGMEAQRLAQQDRQFNQTLGENRRQFDQGFGLQQDQQERQGAESALRYAPRGIGYYTTNNSGQITSGADSYNRAEQQNAFRQSLLSRLGGGGGMSFGGGDDAGEGGMSFGVTSQQASRAANQRQAAAAAQSAMRVTGMSY